MVEPISSDMVHMESGPFGAGETMSIRGIPGAADPTFRTRDRIFVSLDQLVAEVCEVLRSRAFVVSLPVAKCVVQLTRRHLSQRDDIDLEELSLVVSKELRSHRTLVTQAQVKLVLQAYGDTFAVLDIAEIVDKRTA